MSINEAFLAQALPLQTWTSMLMVVARKKGGQKKKAMMATTKKKGKGREGSRWKKEGLETY